MPPLAPASRSSSLGDSARLSVLRVDRVFRTSARLTNLPPSDLLRDPWRVAQDRTSTQPARELGWCRPPRSPRSSWTESRDGAGCGPVVGVAVASSRSHSATDFSSARRKRYWPCRSNSVRLGSSPRAPKRVGGLRAVGRGSGHRTSHDSLLQCEWRRPASSAACSRVAASKTGVDNHGIRGRRRRDL
jgi:hypothetical protein